LPVPCHSPLEECPIASAGTLDKSKNALDLKELEKIACLVFLFGFAAPVLGVLLKGRPNLQRAVFGILCVMIPSGLYKPEEWGLTLSAVEDFYRGHATGYHFYFVEGLALGLMIARLLEDGGEFNGVS
jgi:hypothetical protein